MRALPVEESALSHCAPPKPVAQAPHWVGGSQLIAVSLAQAAANSSARRVPARPLRSALNWPPAAKAIDWPTLALSPASIDSADGIWPCEGQNMCLSRACSGLLHIDCIGKTPCLWHYEAVAVS
jgi:hypothetical protein